MVNTGLDFVVVDVTVADFMYLKDTHFNESAIGQLMKDLSQRLRGRIEAFAPIRKAQLNLPGK